MMTDGKWYRDSEALLLRVERGNMVCGLLLGANFLVLAAILAVAT